MPLQSATLGVCTCDEGDSSSAIDVWARADVVRDEGMDLEGALTELALVRESIRAFALDLTGLTVFTEAATGAFRCTPTLALAAGARRVFAIARDSRFGSRSDAVTAVRSLAQSANVDDERLTIVDGFDRVGEADIVTNLGFVRPLDRRMIARLSPYAVIPLMWETWELRPHELDFSACLARDILVLGTNESDSRLRTMDDVGHVVAKLLAHAEVATRARVLVVGGGALASGVARTLSRAGARVTVLSELPVDADVEPLRVVASLASPRARAWLRRVSALVLVDHHSEHVLVGDRGDIAPEAIAEANPRLAVVHISGLTDDRALRSLGLTVVPDVIASRPRTMSVTTALLGPRPVFALHAAGLRVGEIMARARRATTTVAAARALALRHALCQDFSSLQYQRHRSRETGT